MFVSCGSNGLSTRCTGRDYEPHGVRRVQRGSFGCLNSLILVAVLIVLGLILLHLLAPAIGFGIVVIFLKELLDALGGLSI